MGRQKGTPKTGGRQAGTPNKVTGTIKEHLTKIIDSNREQIEIDLKALEPKDRLVMLERFMQYVIPKKHTEEGIGILPSIVSVRYIGKEGEEVFPSSEDEVDLERELK